MTANELLEMRGVYLRYGPTVALDGVDFTLRAGEIQALLGENGAGKSSLMQVLAGAVRPDAGAMRLEGAPFVPESTAAAQRRGVAMVFQELSLLGHLTIAENLSLGREPARFGWVDRRKRREAAQRVLARLQRPSLDCDRKVAGLAPAERQLVEIARALAVGARVLVLDEPTSSLGQADVRQLFAVLRQLRDDGLGIVFISHALEEVRGLCDRCTVLRDGRTVATVDVAAVDDATLVRHMAGRPLDQVFPVADRSAGPVVLEVEDLAALPLPRRASLQLASGQIHGIGGLAGAGRSELLQAIFGMRPRSAGAVRLRGVELPADPAACWRAGVGYGAEDRKQDGLALRLPIATNVVLPHLRPLQAGGLLRWSRAMAVVQNLGERVSLKYRSPWQAVRELSGGNQQKVAFARLLQAGCDVLLLDEPTRGIDVGSRQEVYHLLDGLARSGAAILVVSSQLPELLGLCDRIAVMRKGVLSPFRPAADWTQESLLHEMMVGESPQESLA
jgi:ribose transport system ATP-binding protein